MKKFLWLVVIGLIFISCSDKKEKEQAEQNKLKEDIEYYIIQESRSFNIAYILCDVFCNRFLELIRANNNFWLPQEGLSELFKVRLEAIEEHINNIDDKLNRYNNSLELESLKSFESALERLKFKYGWIESSVKNAEELNELNFMECSFKPLEERSKIIEENGKLIKKWNETSLIEAQKRIKAELGI